MKIIDFNNDNASDFNITEDDRLWVEENFRWLKDVFGYPNRMEQQVLLTPQFFPSTFSTTNVKIENVVTDLCVLFGIQPEMVRIEILTDLRDFNNIPYETEGRPFECEAELNKGNYKIFIASSLQRNPDRLVYSLIYEFIRIRLTESELEFDVGGDDTELFIYVAGIYYGFGVLLAKNLMHPGQSTDGESGIKWNDGSAMPLKVMAFCLATYANLTGENNPPWKNEFSIDFKKMLEQAIAYLEKYPNDLYNEMEVRANDLFNQANEHFEKNELEPAISTLQKILFLTNDDVMKADVYNNMGYYYLRKKNFAQGVSNFRKALALGAAYGFANDNLGYALIMIGEIEEGFEYLQKAMQSGNNDIAYTYRNLALYHWKKNEFEQAERFFQSSFDQHAPVDLLEYHYGEFLLEQGDVQRARHFFTLSAEKREEEGIAKLQSLDGSG